MLTWWRRRYWNRDETALATLRGKHPATLVTGATRGIGLELAKLKVQQGNTVVLVARSLDDLETTKKRLLEETVKQKPTTLPIVVTIAVDITNDRAASIIRDQLTSHDLYVDELFNNAGLGLSGRFTDEDQTAIQKLIEVNVTALTRLTRAFLPDMLVRGRGGIINIASLGGLTPGPYQAAYYASKAYVISLTQALKHENRGQGVRFCVVAPGPVETGFHAQMDAERAYYRRFLPAMTANSVARSALFWYHYDSTLVVPGFLNTILALSLWLMPGALTIPVVAFLLNPRDIDGDTRSKSN